MSGPEELEKMPFRLAIRSEGAWVVAYHADVDTMEGAQELTRIRRVLLEAKGDPDAFRRWHGVVTELYADFVEVHAGVRPVMPEPEPAPEHERSGRG